MPEPSYLQHTRTAYDTVAHDYAEILRTDLVRKPCDRAVLAAFAELVIAADVGPVLDVGCGPGLVTAHLHHLGVDVTGADPRQRQLGWARRLVFHHPHAARGPAYDV